MNEQHYSREKETDKYLSWNQYLQHSINNVRPNIIGEQIKMKRRHAH